MTALARLYRVARAHQKRLAADDSGTLTVYPSGRTERSYASAPYGEHALAAWWSAKSALAFRRRVAERHR
jgi:hypothetical protein